VELNLGSVVVGMMMNVENFGHILEPCDSASAFIALTTDQRKLTDLAFGFEILRP
jgi:hypothetical protein